MTVLICRHAEVTDHWKKMLAGLRAVLPENGLHYRISQAGNYDAELTVGNVAAEKTLRYDGRLIPVVPFIDVTQGQPTTYWLAWYEAWRQPQTGGAQGRRQFRSSSVTIYNGSAGSNKRQVLRAEWAGAEVVTIGKERQVVFQGRHAAHPHWHLAGLEKTVDLERNTSQPEADERSPTGLAAFGTPTDREVGVADRTALLEGNTSDLDLIDPAWARVHLATSARWAQAEWRGPSGSNDTHATNPASCEEVRSWVISCIRYLQSELQGQISRARW